MKKAKVGKVTIEQLAKMVSEGFGDAAKRTDEGFKAVDERFAKVDERFSQIDEHLLDINGRLAHVELRLGRVEEKFATGNYEARLTSLERMSVN